MADNNEFYGNGSIWIFALLILLLIGGGGFGGNGLAQTDLNLLNAIQGGQRDIETRVQEVGAETLTAIKDASYRNLSEIRDNGMMMSNGFANLQKCCCDMEQKVLENRYLSAQNTACINANTTEQVQKVLDAISQNKIESLQGQIYALQMQNALCGVPRINPYGYGITPTFCGCNGTVF